MERTDGVAAPRNRRVGLNTRTAPTATISKREATRIARRRLRTGVGGASQEDDGGGVGGTGWRGIFRANSFYRADEPVSPAGQGFDVARSAGGVSQGFAKARDGVVQAVIEIDEGFGGPDLGAKLLAGHELAGAVQQSCQDLNRLALQAELDAGLSQLGSPEHRAQSYQSAGRARPEPTPTYELTPRLLRLPHSLGLAACVNRLLTQAFSCSYGMEEILGKEGGCKD